MDSALQRPIYPKNVYNRVSADLLQIVKGLQPSPLFPKRLVITIDRAIDGKTVGYVDGQLIGSYFQVVSLVWKMLTPEECDPYDQAFHAELIVYQMRKDAYDQATLAGTEMTGEGAVVEETA